MDDNSRHFLLGSGLTGMALGAALGIVAGDMARSCAATPALGLTDLCATAVELRLAAFGLVGLSTLVSLVPMVAGLWSRRRGSSG